MLTTKSLQSLGLACAVGAVFAAAPQRADACGGFFCDAGPQPMPVDQTGEDILFVMDPGEVEAHIRIDFAGEAEDFAWVIPVLSVPSEFSVSSEALFENIKAASVPRYGITQTTDACGLDDNDNDGFDSNGSGLTGAGAGEMLDVGSGGPAVLAHEQVGAFDITVIGQDEEGTVTAQEVFEWLGDNGYQQDPAALPIFETYLAEGHAFVAIKLRGSAGVEELHPIALRFDHPEACVPLRLTRIAAVDDMDIRTYFLAEHRVVPSTYKHVQVNPLKIDWPSQGANYKSVITQAVDAPMSEGRAFVTEYAGPSGVVSGAGLNASAWNAEVFADMAPAAVMPELETQGLVACGFGPMGTETCLPQHPMLEPLLVEFLVPPGVDLQAFYADPLAYVNLVDPEQWAGGTEFAARMDERIIEPAEHALEVLLSHGYLTRMYTTVSPHEMTADPMFYENPDLAEVAASRTATARTLCNDDVVWTLPDGRVVYVPQGQGWPEIGGDAFWEETVSEMGPSGAPMVLVNNTAAIDEALALHNTQEGWGVGADPETYVPDGAGPPDRDVGCACDVDDGTGPSGGLLLMGLGGVLGLRLRRRAARRRGRCRPPLP